MSEPDIRIRWASAETIEARWSGFAAIGWEGEIDGARFVVERGVGGDHRFVHGADPDQDGGQTKRTRAVHHLSADARVLLCAPTDRSGLLWWRLVLDSVLFTVALLHGYEALHAGGWATPSGVVAITAASGGGKSTLLAELLGRGHELMADDVLVLEPRQSGPPIAYPAPPLMTVPATGTPQLGAEQPRTTICSLEGERWIAVPVSREPLPLRALVVLDRGYGASRYGLRPTLSRIESPLAVLLGSLMSFPRTSERELARFELASALCAEAGVWRLTADLQTPPSVLADALLDGAL